MVGVLGEVNFYEKAQFVKADVAAQYVAERNGCSALRAMLLSALSVSHTLFGDSVHYGIRLLKLKALQSSDRSLLLLEEDQVRIAQSPLEIRSAFGQQ
jgi:hypothetical protein